MICCRDLGVYLTVYCRQNVNSQSMAMAKHKFQQLVLKFSKQKLFDLLDAPEKLAKYAFGVAAQALMEHFINAKMPRHLEKLMKPGAFGE